MIQNNFEWLTNWCHSQCDRDWEHSARINISTLDNPGWAISINLEETELENKDFKEIKIDNSDTDWLICFNENMRFKGYCGTLNLPEVLQIFRKWAEMNQAIEDS